MSISRSTTRTKDVQDEAFGVQKEKKEEVKRILFFCGV